MAEAIVYTKEGKESGREPLEPALFEGKVNGALLYEYTRAYRANQRLGTHQTKTRAEVSGGGKKPWRQKGTGRARAGSNTSPIWVRGGKSHGPRPRDYSIRLPDRKKRGALISALSEKASKNAVRVLDELKLSAPRTAEMAALLAALKLNGAKNLFVVNGYDRNLFLAARNLPWTLVRRQNALNAYDVQDCANLIFTQESLKVLTERLLKEKD